MYSIKRIEYSKYFAIQLGENEPWITDMEFGSFSRYGISQEGLAWFFDPKEGMFIYDAKDRSLKFKIDLPVATNTTPGKEDFHDDFSPGSSKILQSKNGNFLYYVISHGIVSRDLHVIELASGRIINSIKSIPGGGSLSGNCIIDQDGCIRISSTIKDAGYGYGLARVNPHIGTVETSICENSYASGWLHSPSSDGNFWLRNDNSQLPYFKHQSNAGKLFGSNANRVPPQEFFSFAVEIWQAFPLKKIATVAPMWMTPHELPDEGHLDSDIYLDKNKGKNTDINLWLEGKFAKRAKIYRDIALHLQENRENGMNEIEHNRDGVTDWVWPGEKRYANISSNLSRFKFKDTDLIGWQADNQAFWIMRNSFVVCVGVDGTFSPKIKFERYGMHTSAWLPCAASFTNPVPLEGKRLKVQFGNDTVIADGAPQPPTTAIRTIPADMDHFSPVEVAEIEIEKMLKKTADALAEDRSIYQIPVASESEKDCIAAIEALTAEIGPDINTRPFDNTLKAVFTLDGKKIDEESFFIAVAENYPASVDAIRNLVLAICKHAKSLDSAFYDPGYEDGSIAVGAFGFAALALAKLDPTSNEILLKYGTLIDTYHEHFYCHYIFAAMLENERDNEARLKMAEDRLLGDLGNCFEPYGFWKFAKMGQTANSIYSPAEYARRITQRSNEIAASDLNTNLMGPALARLANTMQRDGNDWERTMVEELKLLAA